MACCYTTVRQLRRMINEAMLCESIDASVQLLVDSGYPPEMANFLIDQTSLRNDLPVQYLGEGSQGIVFALSSGTIVKILNAGPTYNKSDFSAKYDKLWSKNASYADVMVYDVEAVSLQPVFNEPWYMVLIFMEYIEPFNKWFARVHPDGVLSTDEVEQLEVDKARFLASGGALIDFRPVNFGVRLAKNKAGVQFVFFDVD